MPALAPRADPIFGASVGERTFQRQRRGVVAVAPAACDDKMARDMFARRVFATEPSAPPAPTKRALTIRESIAIGKVAVLALPAPRHLKQRAPTEHDGKKAAVPFPRGTGRYGVATAGKHNDARIPAVKRRPEAASASWEAAAAKRRKTSAPSSKHTPEAAQRRTTGPEKQQQQYRVQRAAPKANERKIADVIDKAQEALKRRRRAEIAIARERFRRELLEMEKTAMPDETIYPEDLRELGITAFEYAVTRTRKQALARPG